MPGALVDALVHALVHSAIRHPDEVAVAPGDPGDQGGEQHDAGDPDYLVKPFTFATFAERLRRYAEARREMDRPGELAQEDVDRVFAVVRRPGAIVHPKGSARRRRAWSSRCCRPSRATCPPLRPLSVGISRVVARRYLEYLCSPGQAQQRLRYGTSGRPEHRYRWGSS